MARIQILDLPAVLADPAPYEAPFLLLIDQATAEERAELAPHTKQLADECGARTAFITTLTLDVA